MLNSRKKIFFSEHSVEKPNNAKFFVYHGVTREYPATPKVTLERVDTRLRSYVATRLWATRLRGYVASHTKNEA